MTTVARFEKVSFDQFVKDWFNVCNSCMTEQELREIYDNIQLPTRSTAGSAGYDFRTPVPITLAKNTWTTIPTGIRCKIENGWFLDLTPRSGHGFKYGIKLANTRGIIDSDYYDADNEGHIMIKLVNESVISPGGFSVPAGTAIAQGIFTVFGLAENDNATEKRTGGFGSTDEKK